MSVSSLNMDPAQKESKMSQGFDNPLPGLGSASCEKVEFTEVYKEYASGASYVGQVKVKDSKRAGRGVFTWPNGAKYDGEFVDNVRNGKGIQTWPDGSSYQGAFNQDMRHGHGKHAWTNGESYEGIFYKDRRHGSGKYIWSDASSYSGTFFMDHKEGYGCFGFADGRKYQGLYKLDEREGPGVMTYPDGRQDVGLWHRDHLARICFDIEGAFSMKDHPEFDYVPSEQEVFITPDRITNRDDVIEQFMNPANEFNYEPGINLSSRGSEVFHDCLHDNSVAADVKSCHDEFSRSVPGSRTSSATRVASTTSVLKSAENISVAESGVVSSSSLDNISSKASGNLIGGSSGDVSKKSSDNLVKENGSSLEKVSNTSRSNASSAKSNRSKSEKRTSNLAQKSGRVVSAKTPSMQSVAETSGILAWNNTPSSIEMQKHIIKHSMNQGRAGFIVDDVLSGSRVGFAAKGPLEEAAEIFINAAGSGNVRVVADLLHHGKVYVDVADKSGFTSLLASAVNWHQDVINVLLDNGADVNKLNNEGVSSLAACHVYFYPIDCFRYNIAERYLEKPVEFASEPSYDVNDAVKGILTHLQKKKPHPPIEKKVQNVLEVRRIQRLREEYGGGREKGEYMQDNNNKENTGNDRGNREDSGKSKKTEDRTLGTLKIKRTVRINIDEMLDPGPDLLPTPTVRGHSAGTDSDISTDSDDFESLNTARNFPIDVPDQLIERCATGLSGNFMVVGRSRASTADLKTVGTARRLAMEKAHHQLMEDTIRLLLRRGADPNASAVPMPVLFFAIKAADVDAVNALLAKGASTATTLSPKKGGLTPLHIAAAIPGEEGVQISALLLAALADPDARAAEDDSFLNRNLQDEWSKDVIEDSSLEIHGGRTPLQIACARDDNYKNACSVVHLLLDHHGNPNLLCNGHSPLALAIRSGNDLAIDELLAYHADPCLPLTHGVGSALCVASSTEYEHRRTPDGRIHLIDKLIAAGADILAPIHIGPKRLNGTAVDYAYHLYNLDRRIAHMPYHALTPAERETFNARRRLLGYLGDIMRQKATDKERHRLEEEERQGRRSRSPSPNFVYTGAGAHAPGSIVRPNKGDSKVSFGNQDDIRKPLFRYCYECGRSVGVRLSACTRCKEVYYCSKACKLKAWNSRHKDECVRIKGQSPGPSKNDKRIDSPTPATDADKMRHGINASDPRIKNSNFDAFPGDIQNSTEDGENFGHNIDLDHGHEPGQGHVRGQWDGNGPERNYAWDDLEAKGQNNQGARRKSEARLRSAARVKGHDRVKVHSSANKQHHDKQAVGLINRKSNPKLTKGGIERSSQKSHQVPIKGRSVSVPNKPGLTVLLPNGKVVTVQPMGNQTGASPYTMILPNGKLVFIDNYSFV